MGNPVQTFGEIDDMNGLELFFKAMSHRKDVEGVHADRALLSLWEGQSNG